MSAAVVLGLLGKEIAMPLARDVVKGLSRTGSAQRFQQAIALTHSGVSAVGAMRSVFGEDFSRVLSAASGTGDAGWSFEAGRKEYVRLSGQVREPTERLALLREELNTNLDRITSLNRKDERDTKNYVRGVFAEWRNTYTSMCGSDADATSTFEATEKLLDDTKKSFASALRIMMTTALGSVGAVLVVYGLLVGTATGMGVAATISAWLFGIPFGPAAGIAVPGVMLLALAAISLKDRDAVSAAVQILYKLLDRKLAALNTENVPVRSADVRPLQSAKKRRS
jgi:hypothetical protein